MIETPPAQRPGGFDLTVVKLLMAVAMDEDSTDQLIANSVLRQMLAPGRRSVK